MFTLRVFKDTVVDHYVLGNVRKEILTYCAYSFSMKLSVRILIRSGGSDMKVLMIRKPREVAEKTKTKGKLEVIELD